MPDGTPGDFGLNYLVWDKSNGLASGAVTQGVNSTGGISHIHLVKRSFAFRSLKRRSNPIGQIIDQNTDANRVQENAESLERQLASLREQLMTMETL